MITIKIPTHMHTQKKPTRNPISDEYLIKNANSHLESNTMSQKSLMIFGVSLCSLRLRRICTPNVFKFLKYTSNVMLFIKFFYDIYINFCFIILMVTGQHVERGLMSKFEALVVQWLAT